MGLPRATVVAFTLSFLFLTILLSHHTAGAIETTTGAFAATPVAAPSPANINCGAECGRRCSASSRKEKCNHACTACCHTCGCVPPGTSGNKEVCPCYANLLNPKNGVHKCP